MNGFFRSLLAVTGEMSPYLLLGFLIAGILHVFVPGRFYSKYLSRNNRLSVLYAALLGIPLPLCSCGVIPTAIGLRNEKASKGAVASFLIATPQTGIDSILATFSVLGLGFAIIRPVAALVTGVCGGLLVNRFVRDDASGEVTEDSCRVETGNKVWRVLRYAYFDMIQNIGLRLVIGLLVAALIQVLVPDEFFLHFGSNPLLQMLVILIVAVPMYICSTGSIPVAAALILKGLSPGAALVMLMAGPAVNLASILVVRKSLGSRFTVIYLLVIVGFSILFGLLVNAFGINIAPMAGQDACCASEAAVPGPFKLVCTILLTLFIVFALSMKFFSRFTHKEADPDSAVYTVEGMHCSHCEAAVVRALESVEGVESAKASAPRKTLTVKGTAAEADIRAAVEKAGYTFKGKNTNK
ncbi:MAG: permease [Bacteroidales bacterium]|nr:permease [Bacteroidales bacterium]